MTPGLLILLVLPLVYSSLPPGERGKCGIFCENYALAGAVDFYGRLSGLPRAISGHNSYWLWGTRGYTGEILIIVGTNARDLGKYFDEVTQKAGSVTSTSSRRTTGSLCLWSGSPGSRFSICGRA